MNFDDIVKAVADVCPPFNHFALRDFVEKHINDSPNFPAMVFEEGFKFINAPITFERAVILSPEDRVRFELKAKGSGKSTKAKIPLTVSHLRLVEYQVKFNGEYISTRLYTPYMVDGMLHIRDKRSMVRKVILERTFSRVNEKDKDGISVSPIRVNLTFNRKVTFPIVSYVTGDTYREFIVSGRLFHGGPNGNKTTIMHYMLAKFGFAKTLRRFGISAKDVLFTAEVGQDTEKFEYFAARPYDEKTEMSPGLFLKVRKTLLGDDQSLKFVVNIMHAMNGFRLQTIDNVYVEQGSIWKIILGFIIYDDRAELKAHSNAESHLNSVDYFIDPLTRARFQTFGVMIDDIYDMLVHIFGNIDSFMVNHLVQDLYNSRLDVSNGILVESYARKIFGNLYYLAKKTNISKQDVESALQLNAMMFKMATTNRKDDAVHYIAPPEIIGDNFLFAGGLNKIRLGGKPEQRLHPSMLVAESIDAFVGKIIGKTGYLNPYIPTDEHGAILHPDYAASIDELKPYLPR